MAYNASQIATHYDTSILWQNAFLSPSPITAYFVRRTAPHNSKSRAVGPALVRLPLITATPSNSPGQGPSSACAGRLAQNCVSNFAALTGAGRRSTLPLGQTLLSCERVTATGGALLLWCFLRG